MNAANPAWGRYGDYGDYGGREYVIASAREREDYELAYYRRFGGTAGADAAYATELAKCDAWLTVHRGDNAWTVTDTSCRSAALSHYNQAVARLQVPTEALAKAKAKRVRARQEAAAAAEDGGMNMTGPIIAIAGVVLLGTGYWYLKKRR